MREELVRACDCRLVTGRGDGGDGSDGCKAGDGEERADCRLSYLVFDADSAEESRRRSVAATVKEEELASGVMRARAVMATMAAPLARHRSHRRQRRAQREERVSKQRQPWARAGGGEEPRRKELDEVGFRGAKKGRCAARNAPTKWTAGNEISFFQRS